MTLLDLEDLDHIALGATVLGTGGGGDPTLGKLMAQQAVRRHGPIRLVALDEVADEAWLIPTAMMGAPTVLVEKIPSGTEVLDAFRMVEHHLHSRAFATLSIEAGGVNSMIPMLVAASLGIPIIDADGMGRAFPEIQMVTPSLHGVSATPMAIGDEKGNRVLLETVDNFWTERLPGPDSDGQPGLFDCGGALPHAGSGGEKGPAARDAVACPTNRPDPARHHRPRSDRSAA